MRATRVVPALATALLLLTPCHPTQAAFPGANGRIATNEEFVGIQTMNPDGTGKTLLTSGINDRNPAWSPDGARIAFDGQVTTGQGISDIYVMNADGTSVTQLTNDPADDANPAWSPDGSQIVFESTRDGNRELYTMNADGSNQVRLTNDPATDRDPSWSPDGTKIAFSSDRESYVCDNPANPYCRVRPTYRIFTIDTGGGAATRVTVSSPANGCGNGQDHFQPDWSPSGAQLVYESSDLDDCQEGFAMRVVTTGPGGGEIFYAVDGSPADKGLAWSPDGLHIAAVYFDDLWMLRASGGYDQVITSCCTRTPSWQPIPINSYPRPKGAGPSFLSLVPAYNPCASPNRQHGAPLSYSSCAPPARASNALTLGTPDANGQPAGSVGFTIVRPRADKPSTPQDEADIVFELTVTDVRKASDLSDYGGALEARPVIRITDKDNTPSPGGPGAATVTDLPFPFPVPCTPTAAIPGSTCQTATSADAVAPGSVAGGIRTIWQIQSFEVRDGDGTSFLRQGLFVP